jgi:protocatechuate 3,4-dioxygenase, beta subunit
MHAARPVIPDPGDPRNATDPRAILMGGAFSRSIGQPCAATDDVSGVYRFDIVVGGRNALYFE